MPEGYDPEWPIQCRVCINRDLRQSYAGECAECVFSGLHWHEFRDNWEYFNWDNPGGTKDEAQRQSGIWRESHAPRGNDL